MLNQLFPRPIDNAFRGYNAALWIFGFVMALRMVQSIAILFNGYSTVMGADGIPLDTYPAAAAQTIVGLFAQASLWRLIFCLLGVLVLFRYRSAVPLMFTLFLLNFLGALLIVQFVPLVRTGTPPGPIVNLGLLALTGAGLVLSLWPRRIRT